ncbi:MAG: hypothetical protein WCG48_01560 [Candidatus Berkelbacteria bacterium]
MKNTEKVLKFIIHWRWLFYVIAFLTLAFLSSQYALITNGFPTGDDPAIHIQYIHIYSYREMFKILSYPMPLSIFKFFHSISHLSAPTLFVLQISTQLFLASVSLFFFIKKMTKSNLYSFVGAAAFALGCWSVDSLRMGLFAESFGWIVLIWTLYFLASGNILLTVLSSAFLAFSHPFSFTIFALIFMLYFVLMIFEKQGRKYILIIGGIYIGAIVVCYLVDPAILVKFRDFINPERIGWGERPLWEVLINNDPLRTFSLVFALIGVVISTKNWSSRYIKVLYLLLFVALFMSMNQIFGVRFLVFRFFPYLDIALAIFISLGVKHFVETMKLGRFYSIGLTILIGIVALWPHFRGNNIITSYQVNNVAANDSMTIGDREAIDWLQRNSDSSVVVTATHKRQIWIKALTDVGSIENLSVFQKTDVLPTGLNFNEIYYAEVDQIPAIVSDNYSLIYDHDGVKIFKVK